MQLDKSFYFKNCVVQRKFYLLSFVIYNRYLTKLLVDINPPTNSFCASLLALPSRL